VEEKEEEMRHPRWLGILLLAVALGLGIGPASEHTSWAQTAASAPTGGGDEASGRKILAGVGGFLGSLVYAPFKLVVLCPGMALAAGATYAATLSEGKDTAAYLVRVGCTGTYLVTPGMVQGYEEFQGSGAR
jgi:hypothetical protein